MSLLGKGGQISLRRDWSKLKLTSLQKLSKAWVGSEESVPIQICVSFHHLNHEIQLLLVAGNPALQLEVLLPQHLGLLLVSLLLHLLPLAELAHRLVASLLLGHARPLLPVHDPGT